MQVSVADGRDQIADPPAPAGRRALRMGRLEEALLVVVAEQFGRQADGLGQILRLGRRLHQRADIEQHRHLALIEQRKQRRHGGRQGVMAPAQERLVGAQQHRRQCLAGQRDTRPGLQIAA